MRPSTKNSKGLEKGRIENTTSNYSRWPRFLPLDTELLHQAVGMPSWVNLEIWGSVNTWGERYQTRTVAVHTLASQKTLLCPFPNDTLLKNSMQGKNVSWLSSFSLVGGSIKGKHWSSSQSTMMFTHAERQDTHVVAASRKCYNAKEMSFQHPSSTQPLKIWFFFLSWSISQKVWCEQNSGFISMSKRSAYLLKDSRMIPTLSLAALKEAFALSRGSAVGIRASPGPHQSPVFCPEDTVIVGLVF